MTDTMSWLDRNLRRIVWGVGLVYICAFWGFVLAYVAAPGIRALMDAAIQRPAICEGLSAGECSDAVRGL